MRQEPLYSRRKILYALLFYSGYIASTGKAIYTSDSVLYEFKSTNRETTHMFCNNIKPLILQRFPDLFDHIDVYYFEREHSVIFYDAYDDPIGFHRYHNSMYTRAPLCSNTADSPSDTLKMQDNDTNDDQYSP